MGNAPRINHFVDVGRGYRAWQVLGSFPSCRDPTAYDHAVNALPPDLLERARAFAHGGLTVADARHAATVILLRDGSGGSRLEVYLLRRASTMAFAAGQHVFPGGSVDPRDGEHSLAWSGRSASAWGETLGCDASMARALVCAAVRETFEEAGVLLAGASIDAVVADTTGATWETDRQALLDRSVSLAELLEHRGLVLRSDLLRAWAHWITPEFEPRRFDTRFFVAAVPTGQRARDVSGEADQAVWMSVAGAVRGFQSGALPMLPPTIVALRELAAYSTVAEVLEADVAVTPLMPRAVLEGDDVRLVVDGPDGPVEMDSVVRVRA
jgi:8-oxo-dGTP pyrophosphatase MutT (NUDIX family)